MSILLVAVATCILASIGVTKNYKLLLEDSDLYAVIGGLLLVLAPNAAALVSQLSGGRTEVLTSDYQLVTELSSTASLVDHASLFLLVAFAATLIVRSFSAGTRPSAFLIASVSLLLFATLSTLVSSSPGGISRSLMLLLVVAGFGVYGRWSSVVRGAAFGGLILILGAGVAMLIDPATATASCDRKCGAFGFLANGSQFNYNGFGLLMAALIPVIFLGMPRFRVQLTTLTFALALSSGSRTAAIAALLTVVGIILLNRQTATGKKGVFALACVSCCAVVLVPLLGVSTTALTGRPDLWNLAFDIWLKSPIFGVGVNQWSALQSVGDITATSSYSTHNQFVESLFVSGIVGAGLLVLGIFSLFSTRSAKTSSLLLLLLPIAIMAISERPWNFGRIDWLTWSWVLIASLTSLRSTPTSQDYSSYADSKQ